MLVKTNDLPEPALDYLIAKLGILPTLQPGETLSPSTNERLGAILIRRRRIVFDSNGPVHIAYKGHRGYHVPTGSGPTQLIAAMRLIVHTDFGPRVDVPDHLLNLLTNQGS